MATSVVVPHRDRCAERQTVIGHRPIAERHWRLHKAGNHSLEAPRWKAARADFALTNQKAYTLPVTAGLGNFKLNFALPLAFEKPLGTPYPAN